MLATLPGESHFLTNLEHFQGLQKLVKAGECRYFLHIPVKVPPPSNLNPCEQLCVGNKRTFSCFVQKEVTNSMQEDVFWDRVTPPGGHKQVQKGVNNRPMFHNLLKVAARAR